MRVSIKPISLISGEQHTERKKDICDKRINVTVSRSLSKNDVEPSENTYKWREGGASRRKSKYHNLRAFFKKPSAKVV